MENQAEQKQDITFEDFMKVDIRAGVIMSVRRVPKSKKLLELQVNFGTFKRQILSAIGHIFVEEKTLENMTCTFVLNIPPRTIMGLESHGMILAVGDNCSLLCPMGPVEPGSSI